VTFKLQASLFLACNDLPSLNSIDGGTTRRLRVFNFKSKFCDNPKKSNEFHIDSEVKHKLKKWRPYFMSILINYYKIYNKELEDNGKIEEPEEVKLATDKYKNDNDKFNDFFEECVTESREIISIKVIYGLFRDWWTTNTFGTVNKIPDIKELVRAMKLKYDPDDYDKFKGFKVKVNLSNETELDINNDNDNY
jgi:phage/plasmid-associated DNA primase